MHLNSVSSLSSHYNYIAMRAIVNRWHPSPLLIPSSLPAPPVESSISSNGLRVDLSGDHASTGGASPSPFFLCLCVSLGQGVDAPLTPPCCIISESSNSAHHLRCTLPPSASPPRRPERFDGRSEAQVGVNQLMRQRSQRKPPWRQPAQDMQSGENLVASYASWLPVDIGSRTPHRLGSRRIALRRRPGSGSRRTSLSLFVYRRSHIFMEALRVMLLPWPSSACFSRRPDPRPFLSASADVRPRGAGAPRIRARGYGMLF
ncbi:hypothetical protein B0H13DRAFT_2661908 [Mycena leptocephala]|nr:hypothetical protein B0H13DRAFT_2661908 [Mycena leptocephala]